MMPMSLLSLSPAPLPPTWCASPATCTARAWPLPPECPAPPPPAQTTAAPPEPAALPPRRASAARSRGWSSPAVPACLEQGEDCSRRGQDDMRAPLRTLLIRLPQGEALSSPAGHPACAQALLGWRCKLRSQPIPAPSMPPAPTHVSSSAVVARRSSFSFSFFTSSSRRSSRMSSCCSSPPLLPASLRSLASEPSSAARSALTCSSSARCREGGRGCRGSQRQVGWIFAPYQVKAHPNQANVERSGCLQSSRP